MNVNNDPVLNFHQVCNSLYYAEQNFNDLSDSDPIMNSPNLSLLHLNVRSLPQNNDSLVLYLQTIKMKFHVIALTETWISPETCDLSFLFPDYDHVKVFRDTKKGGGVSLFVHKSISYKCLSSLNVMCDSLECNFIELNSCPPLNKPIVIGAMYRPPNTNISTFVSDHLTPILSTQIIQSSICYIMGDFNINLLNHALHVQTTDFIDTMFASSFFPLINRPTRITHTSSTLIDNIFTNCTYTQHALSGILTSDISDHLPIFHIAKHTVKKTQNHTHPRPIINTRTLHNMHRALLAQNWHDVTQNNDVQAAYTNFSNIITHAYSEHIPHKNTTSKKKLKPWITNALLTSIKRKNKLYAIYLKHKTTPSLDQYKRYKNKLLNLIRISKKSYYNEKLQQNQYQLKQSWKILKEIIGHNITKANKSEFEINGRIITNDEEIANEFNNFFINIPLTLVSQLPQNTPDPITLMHAKRTYPSLFLAPTDPYEIQNIINNLKSGSPGYDKITLQILKHIFPTISTAITHLINLSLQTGIVPAEIKVAKVVPIFKNHDPSHFNNYRPISVLPIFSKLFEKIMYKRLENHLITNNILTAQQFGFRRNHSTSMAISHFTETLYDILEKRQFAIATFLDLSKAFDLVNHKFLLQKLFHYGIRGNALAWFTSYLTNRKQFVQFNNSQSQMQTITSGVPQGSILGPLLFILYMNDLRTPNPFHLTLYADDTTLLVPRNSPEETTRILNTQFQKLHTWFTSNQLIVNISKTNYIVFGLKSSLQNHNFSININNTEINRVYKTKFLGVIIDSELNWRHHITHIKNKISKTTGILLRARKALSTKHLITLYKSLILPHLTYCITIWGSTYKKYIDLLTIAQKKIIRIITYSSYLAHTAPLFTRFKILTIDHLHSYHSLLFAHKLYHHLHPTIMTSTLNPSLPDRPYSLRNNSNATLTFRSLQIARFGLKYKLPRFWNNLPLHFRNLQSIQIFKKRIKQNYFFSSSGSV